MYDPDRLKEQLEGFIDGRFCLLGIGNRYWRDDGVGSLVAEAMKPCLGPGAIDAGATPENHLETIALRNPDSILLVDATDFGSDAGDARVISPEKVSYSGVSTHAGSLRMLAMYLQERTKAPIALLAIQPADTSAGEGLSPPVLKTYEILTDALSTICLGLK